MGRLSQIQRYSNDFFYCLYLRGRENGKANSIVGVKGYLRFVKCFHFLSFWYLNIIVLFVSSFLNDLLYRVIEDTDYLCSVFYWSHYLGQVRA